MSIMCETLLTSEPGKSKSNCKRLSCLKSGSGSTILRRLVYSVSGRKAPLTIMGMGLIRLLHAKSSLGMYHSSSDSFHFARPPLLSSSNVVAYCKCNRKDVSESCVQIVEQKH